MEFKTRISVLQGSGNVKAMVSLIVDDTLEVGGFKVVESKSGELFVAPPSNKGKDKEGNDKYYDQVRFIDEREEGERDSACGRAVKEQILQDYLAAANASSKGKATPARTDDRNRAAANAQSKLNGRPAAAAAPAKPAAKTRSVDW